MYQRASPASKLNSSLSWPLSPKNIPKKKKKILAIPLASKGGVDRDKRKWLRTGLSASQFAGDRRAGYQSGGLELVTRERIV